MDNTALPSVVNLAQKFERIHEYWSPKIAGELNGQQVKLAKLKGEFIWHSHEQEDELFFVVRGCLRIEFRETGSSIRMEEIHEGEFLVVPRGIEHRPVADDEVWLLLFEPSTTLNTGTIHNERTRTDLERI